MKHKWVLLVIMLLVILSFTSCHKQEQVPRYVVVLLDVSASIEPEAQKEALASIEALAGRLERGDRLTLIPITGDAATQSSGRILRLERPTKREAFDADLGKFKHEIETAIETLKVQQLKHPGAMTDIMGSLRVAGEEIAMDHNPHRATIIVLSDFIEEDSALNFNDDPNLANKASAELLGEKIAKTNLVGIDDTPVYLGLLRSKELKKLPKNRRQAIDAFWLKYLSTLRARAYFAIDGIDVLRRSSYR